MSFYSEGGRQSSDGGGGGGGGRDRGRDRDNDKPPFSRLFIVCAKHHTQEELRDAFTEYGHIEDIWVVKDRNTKENRGIAYIQYSKMSEACLALEHRNGQRLSPDDSGQALKVIMAQPRGNNANADTDLEDETALTRLFVLIPRGMEEQEVREKFSEFGDIEYVQAVKDRNTGEKKGFGYVKYHRAYDAARALEDVDRVFKPVMAEPKSSKIKRDNGDARRSQGGSLGGSYMDLGFGSGGAQRGGGGGGGGGGQDISYQPAVAPASMGGFDEGGLRSASIGNRLQVNCAYNVTSEQLARLFDLIPGMELCDLKKNFSTGESKGVAIVVYNSVGSATYAKEKLHSFEYPPGSKLVVRYAPDGEFSPDAPAAGGNMAPGGFGGGGGGGGGFGGGGSSYCSVQLPPAQVTVKTDEVAERLFIVCQPTPPPSHVLIDVFSRFGDLIDVFTLKNKNFGYAKFASVEGAEKAMAALHGAEVCGSKLKVLTAEPPKNDESARKRPRT